MTVNVALLGLGTVGQGVYETVVSHQEELRQAAGESVRIPVILIKDSCKNRSISGDVEITTDFNDIFKYPIDAVIEAVGGCEPVYGYLRKCLERKIPVITANKELLAKKGSELMNTADRHQTELIFEASVAGSIPILYIIKNYLKVNRIQKLEAILNGTSNFILTAMRNNKQSFEQSLAEAQRLGYAEADPSNDILGWDTFYKTMILSELIYHRQPDWNDVVRKGIDQVTLEDINAAIESQEKIKLMATLSRSSNGSIKASIEPVRIKKDHPLYAVEGVNNAVRIKTDLADDLVLSGPGAGAFPTASAIMEDFVSLFKNNKPLKDISKKRRAVPLFK
ncbi:homoserine dehydrogenase [Scopulibacillus daqui]|uniref:Homoserine dehydrogenase n=1 Tax=Scopulibacillus daqui TaxID=1469162 RepID=A0ABS2Q2B5_9BACL|nr:homoserine dehydrogenase [Scopulibacillus daqui]MBM7646419.1 homoserine dehydrogenase [Scopulibacillus daqui]